MRTIHAWVLENETGDPQFEAEVDVPKGTELLGTRLSTSGLQVFGIVPDTGAEVETRRFLVTNHGHREREGEPLPEGVGAVHYFGTATVYGGPTVHVFETTGITADV